jgi:hypothetical protein
MKSVTGFIVGAILLAALGTVAVSASRTDQAMANAQELMATLQFEAAALELDEADKSLRYARWLPWIGADAVREVAAKRAALEYYQGEYAGLLPEGDPVAAVDENNVPLQFVVANAVFRDKLRQAATAKPTTPVVDRQSMIQALDEAAAGYLTVLKGERFHQDAAFNYELTVKLRDQVAKGQRPPSQAAENAELGESGAPSPATSSQGFEIYVPLQSEEKTPAGGDAGKVSTKDRKG